MKPAFLFAVMSLSLAAPAVAAQDAQKLQALSKRIDLHTVSIARSEHIERLTEDFHVPLSVIEDARAKGRSWGDITVELALAQSLSEKDPLHYPTTADALFQIQWFTSHEKMTRPEIVRQLKIPLSPALLAAARHYNRLRPAS